MDAQMAHHRRQTSMKARPVARGAAAVLAGLAVASAGTPGVAVAAPAVPATSTAPAVPTATAAPTAAGKIVKYYIVTQQPNGEPEFLFSIAEKVLGDGNRFPEIFELNKGRRQPDGSVMDKPTVIAPGWILQLPEDAKGDGVRLGALPKGVAQTPAAQRPDTHSLPQAQGLVPPTAEQTSWLGPGLGIAAGALAVGALASTFVLRRRTATAAGPVEVPAAFLNRRSTGVATGAAHGGPVAATRTVAPAAPAPRSAQRPARPAPEPEAAPAERTSPAVRTAVPITPRRPAADTASRVRPTPARPAPRSESGPPAAPSHQVSYGDDLIDVHIDTEAAAAWHPVPYETPDGGAAFLCIGVSEEHGCLFVDFAQASGAIAVKGDPDAGRRLVESLVLQLATSPVLDQAGVVVVGGLAVLADGTDGIDTVESLDELVRRRSEETADAVEFVFCEAASADDVAQISGLLRGPGRVVPVVLGRVGGTAWHFEVRAGEPEE
ncbi:LysM peptidoglycan-binding domain-containing protein [Streptomyces sp. NPDC001514]